jgi:tetratricopeptide (TPR) repeat protein
MRALVVSLALLLLGSSVALAQTKDEKEAEKAFKAANTAYEAKDYPKAVEGFLRAYQLAPKFNALLFNIGQAYRMSGDAEKALSYYEKFVQFEPGSPNIPEAKKHIQDLQSAALTAQKEREARAAEEERIAAEAAAKKAEEERAARAAQLATQRAAADKAGSGLRTGGLVVGGLGVVGVGVGIALAASDGIDAKSGVALGAGGAALVAGGVMYYLGVKQRRDARAALPSAGLLVPQLAPGGVAVAWVAEF